MSTLSFLSVLFFWLWGILKVKLHQKKLTKQGTHHSELLQLGKETELNLVETKSQSFEVWGEVVEKYGRMLLA